LDKNDNNARVTSGKANSNKRSESHQEVVLVNPHAFEIEDADVNLSVVLGMERGSWEWLLLKRPVCLLKL
jgi:hypothetical protein